MVWQRIVAVSCLKMSLLCFLSPRKGGLKNPFTQFPQRPTDGICHDWVVFIPQTLFQQRDKFFLPAVAHCNANVAPEARIFSPPNRCMAIFQLELFFRQSEALSQIRRPLNNAYSIFCLCSFINRADTLALVAAKNPVSHCFSEFLRYFSTVLDRQVAQAAPGIDAAIRQNCLRWACPHAQLAIAASISFVG